MRKILMDFNYLHRSHLLFLVLTVTAGSTLFVFTAQSFLGFYDSFNSYLGEDKDVVAVYDRRSNTPFTGLIPLSIVTQIQSYEGVLAVSPESITPVTVKDTSIFLRGIMPENFAELTPLTMLQGSQLELEDFEMALIGKRLAEKLGAEVGEGILVFGVLRELYMELRIKGIYESGMPLDDEILTPIYVGQWLRGTGYGYVSILRIKIDGGTLTAEDLWTKIAEKNELLPSDSDGGKPSKPSWPEVIMPILNISFKPENIGVKETQEFMMNHLNKYGVTLNTLLILAVTVFILASASTFIASKTLMQQHQSAVTVLRSIGMSKRHLKIDVLIKVLPYSLVASIAGTAVAMVALLAISKLGFLKALCHTITPQFDPTVVAVNIVLTLIITTVGIAYSELKR